MALPTGSGARLFPPLPPPDIQPYLAALEAMDPTPCYGEVVETAGLVVESRGPMAALGEFLEIRPGGERSIRAQVIGFRHGNILAMPLDETDGLRPGARAVARPAASVAPVGEALLGRVVDGFCDPIDDGPPLRCAGRYPLFASPPGPLERANITDPLVTGIRAIDGLLPCGKGQRIGIFGGSGVGKSTLLGAMAGRSSADVSVIALVGERNREVREFLEHELGPEGMQRSVVVVATSDRPAPLRVRACFLALAISEYFRDQGADVLLVMDSVTRLAMAQREIGLAAGEPPSQKGYTPSVFAMLPRVFERAGRFARGSITGFFTVLVEGDDFNEPVCDAVRAILDGHIILSRRLGAAGHYPAIDVLNSVSRLASKVATREHQEAAGKVREALAAYARSEDLIRLGAYAQGADPQLDASIRMRDRMTAFLRQSATETADLAGARAALAELAAGLTAGRP